MARVFRSSAMRFLGWAWVVFAAANLVDIIWRGRTLESLIAAVVMVLGSGIAYVVALRPRIVADGEGVRLHNLFRDVRIPWGAIERVKAGDAVHVHCVGATDGPFRAWAMQTSPRSRSKLERKAQREQKKLPEAVAAYVKDRTPTDFVADQLHELLEEHRGRQRDEEPRRASVAWAWPAILVLAIPGIVLAVLVVVAATR